MPSPLSPESHARKRGRLTSPERAPSDATYSSNPVTSPHSDAPREALAASVNGGGTKVGQSSNFRNVSACNRCRLRKNRCDQNLPSCASCDKAGVACVGYDPITKKEIPRSYVYYLEARVEQLESMLQSRGVLYPPASDLEHCSRPAGEAGAIRSPTETVHSSRSETMCSVAPPKVQVDTDETKLQKWMSRTGTSTPRQTGPVTGLSFARVVFAAVQSSVSDQKSTSEKGAIRPYKPIAGNGSVGSGTSMRDSFFGLHTKPTIRPAAFPERELGHRLATLYFEHANPQIPVLHKNDFMHMFEQAYTNEGHVRGPKELYMLNMVFAIGGGIIMGDTAKSSSRIVEEDGSRQCQPEEYHASAIIHLEACLSNGLNGLEELQAVLLLANFALLRPVPPGLWYIVGVAVRLAVDLGLHYEDGKDVEVGLGEAAESHARERGRREYTRDLRRRLFWCTYSFDRLASVCVGRPFGISDQVITTSFPSLLEDKYITQNGFTRPPSELELPTYKLAAHHYFRLRLLQSEILQVLQYQQAQLARASSRDGRNPYMNSGLPSPFLSRFDSFRSWRIDIDRRLFEWKNEAPSKEENGVAFSTEFLELNYWQAIIMLYRQSLSVPAMFEGEYHTSKEVNNPTAYPAELREDEERVYVKVAEAGQKILRLYRQLHVKGLVNYTYLATHHLFMAGISYLYAIWHSPVVRSRLTMDEVDFTILAATSVFTDLIEKCPPAEACRDAFQRTAKATVKMANSKGGFGRDSANDGRNISSKRSLQSHSDWSFPPSGSHHQHRRSINQRSSRQVDPSGIDPFSTDVPLQLPALQSPSQYRPPNLLTVKTEPDTLSHMRNTVHQDHVTPPDAAAIDPSLLPSPTTATHYSPSATMGQAGSPVSTFQPQAQMSSNQGSAPTPTSVAAANFLTQQPVFSPGGLSFSDLQGMDFLQSPGGGPVAEGDADAQMDLGFGLGWEGLHHDFSDGQQMDLFDGFFFGGQQGS